MCASRMEVGTPTSSGSTTSKSSPSTASSSSTSDADAAAGTKGDPLGSVEGQGDESDCETPRVAIEVVLARLVTDTLSSLTRTFEKEAVFRGEVIHVLHLYGDLFLLGNSFYSFLLPICRFDRLLNVILVLRQRAFALCFVAFEALPPG